MCLVIAAAQQPASQMTYFPVTVFSLLVFKHIRCVFVLEIIWISIQVAKKEADC